jgi:hypothetical protein
MSDFTIENHGSLFLVRPLTEAARDWLNDHVADEAQWFGGALAVEPRYVDALVEGMVEDGLEAT